MKTNVIFVLDRSGSMQSVKEEAIDAFNEQLQTLKDNKVEDTRVSLISFNERVESIFTGTPVDRVNNLDGDSYRPSGCTALLDALWEAMEFGESEELGENDANLVVVVSDGMENASKLSQEKVVERIQRLEATNQWTFTFMCANVDITKIQKDFNVPAGNVQGFQATPQGTRVMANVTSVGLSSYMNSRKQGMNSVSNFYQDDTGRGDASLKKNKDPLESLVSKS